MDQWVIILGCHSMMYSLMIYCMMMSISFTRFKTVVVKSMGMLPVESFN